jgi:transcriptional regulator with XRE-family HTH domain
MPEGTKPMPSKDLDNATIGRRIREARKQADLTQEDLARHLRRTSAAISDLERGKVQVSAVDLYKLSKQLKRPIEYFYGEDFGGKEVQGLLYALRKAPGTTRRATVSNIQKSLRMLEIADELKTASKAKDKQAAWRLGSEFFEITKDLSQQGAEFTQIMQEAEHEFKGLFTTDAEAKPNNLRKG